MRGRQFQLMLRILLPTLLWSGEASWSQDFPVKKPAEQTSRPSSGRGMATGVAHAPVKDAKSRPITAGGFVDGAPVVFVDATAQAGLGSFHHRMGTPVKTTILETNGSGVALLDYDNDGWLDVYLLNGSTVATMAGKEAQ